MNGAETQSRSMATAGTIPRTCILMSVRGTMN
nr:MAG TPA: hypothetical protein [Caudoviricetes sp.]